MRLQVLDDVAELECVREDLSLLLSGGCLAWRAT